MLDLRLRKLLSNQLTSKQAKEVHAQILKYGLSDLLPLLVHRILLPSSSYSRAVAQYVQRILFRLKRKDAFSWSCAIRFSSVHGQFRECILLYSQMGKVGLCPTSHAVSSALRAYARIECPVGGISIHAQIHKYGFCHCIYVQTALVDYYTKLGDMDTACKVVDEMPERTVVSWNSILSGHLKSGDLVKAHELFDRIPRKDIISWNTILSGHTKIGNMDHAYSLFQQMPEKNLASWNSMIGGFVECGKLNSARNLFDVMPQRNNISWITMITGYSKVGDTDSACELFDQMEEKDHLSYNAMIACFAQNSRPKEALKLFDEMLKADPTIHPDEMTFTSIISACSQLVELTLCSWAESLMNKLGIQMDDKMATSFIDMYSKSGSLDKAYNLFHSLKKKDVVAYSAMIFGCGINGKAVDATNLFQEMVVAQICPNPVTFTGLLTAYNHAGLVEEGYQCFRSMKDHGLVPSSDHYAIMVDLLGRAGRLEEASELIKSMPMQPHVEVWGALLLACSLHNNVEFGEIAAQHCFELESAVNGYHSLLSNIYSSVGRWEDAKQLRVIMENKKLARTPGSSWMEEK